MITEKDIDEAIAECKGQRNPNAGTAMKLAAFLTLKEKMFQSEQEIPQYSYASAPQNTVEINSGTEFAEIANGMNMDDFLKIMDELMSTLFVTNRKLYEAVLRKLDNY